MGERRLGPVSDAPSALGRSAQTLPIPLGGLAPVHRNSTAIQRVLRRHRSAPLLALAIVAAGTGAWLSTSPRSFDAGRDDAGVHIDDFVLEPLAQSPAGMQVFTGVASLVIANTSAGVVRAGAVMSWNGFSTSGRCVLAHGAASTEETCDYLIGTARLSSTDTYTAATRTWHRRYSDGVEIAVTVPGGTTVIPIPFPLGR